MIRRMRILLLIGTRKGAFIAKSDAARRSWTLEGPFLKGCEVNHVAYLPSTRTIVAAGKSGWFGPGLQLSEDEGKTWREPAAGIRFDESRGHSVERIWTIKSDP